MQGQQPPHMVRMGVATKYKISSLFPQSRNIQKPTVKQNRIWANLNTQTYAFVFVANAIGQTRQLTHRKYSKAAFNRAA